MSNRNDGSFPEEAAFDDRQELEEQQEYYEQPEYDEQAANYDPQENSDQPAEEAQPEEKQEKKRKRDVSEREKRRIAKQKKRERSKEIRHILIGSYLFYFFCPGSSRIFPIILTLRILQVEIRISFCQSKDIRGRKSLAFLSFTFGATYRNSRPTDELISCSVFRCKNIYCLINLKIRVSVFRMMGCIVNHVVRIPVNMCRCRSLHVTVFSS